ncbi:PTS galactitol transporter subunit IIC [Micropruina sonneratiae]|uniref:PTS galactitol transporter subunit IIC n=1 Tax=Micropruina sonneratiae TaxID=2986940 RepID=UPI00222778AE|nr:PTS transporter subunit IIC [Micropruina sp. KQZ13P-5]MCW3156508.1 PTS sugar transporter subunit IIC [Micropruina sp. KQZ13P-5]
MDGFNNALSALSGYLSDLGASITLPFLIIIFGMILGQKFTQALRAGLLIGVGFIGLNLVIGLMGTQVGPAAEGIAHALGVNLTTIDVGWPSSAAIAFGSQVGAIIIPVGLLVNIVLLATGLTRTLNIDLWNFWHSALVGALVSAVTMNFWLGIAAAAVHMTVVLALADLSAPWIQKYFNFPDISFPHGTSAPYIAFAAPLNWLFDRIPGFNKLQADPESIQKRFGVFGEAMILGFILGALLGIFGFGFDDPRADSIAILTLAVSLAAVMVLLPRMVALLMEGLIPISESAKAFVEKRFPNRKFYIGLDSAIAVGQPAVLATSLVLVPVTVVVAVALAPLGNTVLPLVDLATIPFIVAMMVPIFRGNIIRSVIGGAIVIGLGLFIATATAASFTQIAASSGFELPTGATQISSLVDGANPLTGLFFGLASLGGWTIGLLAVLALAFAYWVSTVEKKRDVARAAAEQQVTADA